MSMSYNLALVCAVPPESVLRRIRDVVGGELIETGQLLVVPELIVGASVVDDPNSRELYREEWGIDMATSVGFGVSTKTGHERQYAAAGLMSLAAVQLVVRLGTEAGMTFQHERKLLHRRDGVLYLYDWWPQWAEPAVRAGLPEGYILTGDDPAV